MSREFRLIGLHVFIPNVACAHECEYCLWGKKQYAKLPFDRAARLIERLAEWKYAHRPQDYLLNFDPGYSRNVSIDALRAHNELNERIGNGVRYAKSILLGGLKFRPPQERREWVIGLRELGVDTMVASLAGYGEVHDHWNGRRGDFDHLMDLMRTGAEIGIRSNVVFFIVKSTYPLLDGLKAIVDAELGAAAKYIPKIFNYLGASLALEHERIAEDMRASMPDWITANLGEGFQDWRSEREWIEVIMQEPEPVVSTQLKLVLTDANIERLESMPARLIIDELEAHTAHRHRELPSLKTLCAHFGDRASARIYQNRMSVDALWQDRSGSGAVSQSRYSDMLREVPDALMRPHSAAIG